VIQYLLKIKRHNISTVLIAMFFLIAAFKSSKASEVATNWSWLNLRLVILQTNLAIGENISASVVASNLLENEHVLRWNVGDPCNYGLGRFEIVEMSSGNKIDCKLTRDERAQLFSSYRTFLQGHKSKIYEADLLKGYVITNAGVYSVQAVGWFPINEPPTNNQYTTVISSSELFNRGAILIGMFGITNTIAGEIAEAV
jgi:hypothetical protein